MELEQRTHHDKGNTVQDIADTLHHQIRKTAIVALHRTVHGTDEEVDHGYADRDQKTQSHAACKTQRHVIPLCVRTQKVIRLKAVYVAVIIVVQHTHLVLCRLQISAAGVFIIFQIAVLVALVIILKHHALAVGKLCNLSRRHVNGHGNSLAVCLVPEIGVVRIKAEFVILHQRIEHLKPGLLLPCTDQRILGLLNTSVLEAHLKVGVDRTCVARLLLLCGIQCNNGIADVQHGLVVAVQTLLKGCAVSVPVLCTDSHTDRLHQTGVGKVSLHAAVRNAERSQPCDAGRFLCIIDIHKGHIIPARQKRRQERKQDDQDNNDRRNHGSTVLAEPDPRVLEVADGFVIKFLVCDSLPFVDKGELFLGDILIFHICLCHLISPPF